MGKDCGNHGDDGFKRSCRRLLAILLTLALIAGVIALIVYLVLRPTHPRFVLQDANLQHLDLTNTTSAPLLSTVTQVTIASRNPNARVGVHYDRLDFYASYKYQQVTLASRLPAPIYQGHGDVDVWSPVLAGPNVPFAPFLADAMRKDLANGYIMMEVRIDGRVRWKVGSWTSGHYHIFVTCPAYFISSGANRVVGAHGLRFQTPTYCRVEV
ncbi:hypothetical protein HU200_067615 [Digitaria exilis]|uniref:Late embryogenesis abundant protein LEA-2 subgroup domain-containing protein n=1 Tax=Digitaria exilis TaxID=1010633 RepID=A0A834ZW21_9POAL|nr:hypothetical protein HU200_067615 [Digitaria exilis]CAB3489157.1 unnamed protein product [Digitaria exilis]